MDAPDAPPPVGKRFHFQREEVVIREWDIDKAGGNGPRRQNEAWHRLCLLRSRCGCRFILVEASGSFYVRGERRPQLKFRGVVASTNSNRHTGGRESSTKRTLRLDRMKRHQRWSVLNPAGGSRRTCR